MSKSAYSRRGKTPYPYVYPRCAHSHTHDETYAVTDASGLKPVRRTYKVAVCDVCNTLRGLPRNAKTETQTYQAKEAA